jgi:hypothetical protein
MAKKNNRFITWIFGIIGVTAIVLFILAIVGVI